MHMNDPLTRCPQIGIVLTCLAVIAAPVIADDGPTAVGIFVVAGDEQAVQFTDVLKQSENALKTRVYATLEEAINSDTETLVISMGRSRQPFSDEMVAAAKQKKIIGVGYGAAQLFGKLGLEINDGACAHFGAAAPKIQVRKNQLLGGAVELAEITPYSEPAAADNFGMYVPERSDHAFVVDVIARISRDTNYAPIVAQNNYVMIGLSATPTAWSLEYRSLFSDVVAALHKQPKKPFGTAEFPLSPPGEYAIALGNGRSTKHLSSKTYYFKIDKPTVFSATLAHGGSNAMMMLFMGEKDRMHWTREDAKDGETLRIVAKISADDLKRIGDSYWTLKVTNFDRDNPATCVLDVKYGAQP